jgi:hypothetical protein
MQTERLGIINFFGIFIPGSYIAGIVFLVFTSSLKLAEVMAMTQFFNIISQNMVLSSVVLFFISYLFGVLVRLLSPNAVDRLSKFFLYYILQKRGLWVTEIFPYKESILKRLSDFGMGKIHYFIENLSIDYGKKKNTAFLNYCKYFIDANSPTLSRQIREAEALVRFLSGTTAALILAITASIAMLILAKGPQEALLRSIYWGLLFVSIICLIPILWKFKHQRRREVLMVWFCVYIILNGGILEYDKCSASMIAKSVFF